MEQLERVPSFDTVWIINHLPSCYIIT